MAFSSQLLPGETIIHDSTPEEHFAPPEGFGKGLDLSGRTDAGYEGTADMFPDELLIPESEWQARIQEMEERKTRLSDLIIQAGLPCKDQAQTNYCWVNAPTHCSEIVRLVMNQPMVILSPASAGAQVVGFRNVGGWGKDALDWIIQHGQCPVDIWPANAIERKYATPANAKIALDYRVTEWWEAKPRNLKQLVSIGLRRQPNAIGLSWWHHEVTAVEPVWIDGTVALRIRNSWGMDWPKPGAGGFSILQGSKMLPDDSVTPRVGIAS